MKTLYMFGFEIEERPTAWTGLFKSLFDIDFSEINFVTSYANKEKNWNETFKEAEALKERRQFLGHDLASIHCSFNRYQERVYLALLFDEKIRDTRDIKRISIFIKKTLADAIVGFTIPFKEPDLYADYRDKRKYEESVLLENPAYILDKGDEEPKGKPQFDKTPKKYKEKNFNIIYRIGYRDNKKNRYERILRQYYQPHKDCKEALVSIIEHYHSVFVLFHRAEAHYQELRELDQASKLLTKISDHLNEIWPRQRIKLFLINRFINASLYNRTFYSILELNAQMDSIFSHIRMKYQKIEDKYDKQYERVFHNFDMAEKEDDSYYADVKGYLFGPSRHRKKELERIKNFFEPTNLQIERLRNDNDSKVNFAIQWIMSILSVVIFFWGISTFWYQGIMVVERPIIDRFLTSIQWVPSHMLLLISITLMAVFLFIFYFLIHNSSLTSRDMKKTIGDQALDTRVLEKNIDRVIKHKEKQSQRTLLYFTETFKLVTTHLIMNFDNEKKDLTEYMRLIDRI